MRYVAALSLVAATASLSVALAAAAGEPPVVTSATCQTDAAMRSGVNAILSGRVRPYRPYRAGQALAVLRRAGWRFGSENDLLDLVTNVPAEELCDYRWYATAHLGRPELLSLYVLSTPATAKREQRYHVAAARRSGAAARFRSVLRGNVLVDLQLPLGSPGPVPVTTVQRVQRALQTLG
jgi:hypothetical protein